MMHILCVYRFFVWNIHLECPTFFFGHLERVEHEYSNGYSSLCSDSFPATIHLTESLTLRIARLARFSNYPAGHIHVLLVCLRFLLG